MSLVCNVVFLVGFLEFPSVHHLSGPPRTHLLGVCVFRQVGAGDPCMHDMTYARFSRNF